MRLHGKETRSEVPVCLQEPGFRAGLKGYWHRIFLDGGPRASDGLLVRSGSAQVWSFGSGVGERGSFGFTSITPEWCVQGSNLVPGLVRNRTGPV